jgi:hypothetical protein
LAYILSRDDNGHGVSEKEKIKVLLIMKAKELSSFIYTVKENVKKKSDRSNDIRCRWNEGK